MKLDVGMTVYSVNPIGGIRKYTVSRVTPKRAYVKLSENAELCFDREVKGGRLWERGATSNWSRTTYYLETEELKNKYKQASLANCASKIDMHDLTVEQLEKILEICIKK